ncbi:MAG: helix-turn-helix transcriptional regulator, partial [Cyclobacteriaceae bacterium]
LNTQTSEYVRQLLLRMYRAYSETGLAQSAVIQSYLIALLCEVNSAYQPLSGSKQTAAVSIANHFRELLFANIKSQHRVSDYAAQLSITPNHLNKSVKAITGKSPTKWIDETLVLEAKVLLYQTDLAITEVAAEIGIFDASYFTRLFKKYEGLTPLEFRKLIETS